ncbi:acetyltransferase (GNAT) family protein [Duganella sp. HH101]|nr:acetyltransferase (GNAT) family protein [Duganella sp. HH101]
MRVIDVDNDYKPQAAQKYVNIGFLIIEIMTTLHIGTNKADLDVPLIHQFISEQSTWAIGMPLAVLERAIEHSLCFGAYLEGRQIGFARVVTDCATFANLLDVFVLPEFRGRGFSKQLMEAVLGHPDLQGLRRFTLATGDAHGLYEKFGFTPPSRPATLMERYFPNIYSN